MPTNCIRLTFLIFAITVVAFAGCSREAFRQRADKDVEAVISQKNVVPQWEVKNWHAYPDARARFADPSCPDFPPYPPDDYAARMLSPNPQRPGNGGAGRYEGDGYLKQIAEWDTANRAEDAARTATKPNAAPPVSENAAGESYLNALRTNEQPYRLRMEQAVELALYNSREFQDRREDLYLAALPVTLERYTFSAQAFAAETAILEMGGQATANPGNRWRINTEAGVSRRFSTGAELIVKLANQVVIELGSGQPQVSVGTIGLALTIPFLRGGGFAVTLEPLTQAERTLLYAIRSYARFRSLFYTAITGQGDYTNNPYGLQGLSANLGRGIGANLTANQIGYLPTILRSAVLANERSNVTTFENYQKLFKNLEEGGNVTKLLVGRIEQQLLQGRATVLLRQQEYIDNIDNFKLQLGVPATVPLELDETPLKPIREQLTRIEEVYLQLNALEVAAGSFVEIDAAATSLRSRWMNLLTDTELSRGTETAKSLKAFFDDWSRKPIDNVTKRLSAISDQRSKLQLTREDQLKANQSIEATVKELDQLEIEYDRLRLEEALRRYESKPWMKEPDARKREAERLIEFRAVNGLGVLVAIQARNEKLARYKAEWVELPPIVLDDQDILRIPLDSAYLKVAATALNNRFDLMNARAQVVDAWRQVAIRANSLRGVFDVEYDLSTNSPAGGSNPAALGGSRTLQQLRLRWEPPFVRRAERNQYRASLIAYQRQRRNLMAFEDNIVTEVRTDLRLLRQLSQTFLVQQRAVELAYLQSDNARGTLLSPPDPRVDSAAAAVAQTEQLLQVQAALVRAQNDLYSTWVRYLNARMSLYLDLELLSLDARGLWVDEQSGITTPESATAVAAPAVASQPVAPVAPGAPAGPVAPELGRANPPERLPAPRFVRDRPGSDTARLGVVAPLDNLPDPDAYRAQPDLFPAIDLPAPARISTPRGPEIPGAAPLQLPTIPRTGK